MNYHTTKQGSNEKLQHTMDAPASNKLTTAETQSYNEQERRPLKHLSTVKPVFSGHAKIDKTKISITNGSVMKVESIADCILQYF